MKINFIRHGMTAGNHEKLYIGVTDEPLCDAGVNEINDGMQKYPSCDILICSPMKRCLQTAKIIYPDKKPIVCNGLRECDFGDFEGKSYIELSGDKRYQAWIDSGGKLPFPNGETHENFKIRCCNAFMEAVKDFDDDIKISFVIHGGSIMAVLEKFTQQKNDFYSYQIKNGCGFCTEFDGENIIVVSKF